MTFVRVSAVNRKSGICTVDDSVIRKMRYKLDFLAQELSIAPKDLNEISKEVTGRDCDTRLLSISEHQALINYLKQHYIELGERNRKKKWS